MKTKMRLFSLLPLCSVCLLLTGCQALVNENKQLKLTMSQQKKVIFELSETNVFLKQQNADLTLEAEKALKRAGMGADVSDLSKAYESKLAELLAALQQQVGVSAGGEKDYIVFTGPSGDTTIRILDQVLFKPGSAALSSQGENVLHKIAKEISKFGDGSIRVAGHTDSDPIRVNKQFSSNWHLSAVRAKQVVELLEKSGVPGKRMYLAGFSYHQPVDASKKSLNRRVEITLVKPN